MPKSHDENFLVRWSRRKQADRLAPAEEPIEDAQSATNAAAPDGPRAAHGSPDHAAQPPREADSDAEADAIPGDLADVDIEALNYESDFKRFLESDVPEALRKRALRQLWRSDPILANVDGLNDYDEDFTDAALAVKTLATAYKIGRGYLESEDDEAETGLERATEPSTDPDETEATDDEILLSQDEDDPTTEPNIERGETEA